MEDKREVIVNMPPELQEPKYSNIFKIGYTETDFNIDFGFLVSGSDEKLEINIVSKVVLPIEKLMQLVTSLFQSGVDYEDQFKKEIGFSLEQIENSNKE